MKKSQLRSLIREVIKKESWNGITSQDSMYYHIMVNNYKWLSTVNSGGMSKNEAIRTAKEISANNQRGFNDTIEVVSDQTNKVVWSNKSANEANYIKK